jgi:xanthine dehydrogenase accessory factor
MPSPLTDLTLVIKGAGEMASGVAHCLHRAGFTRLLMLELPAPLAVRRTVCFCEAVYDGRQTVEGVTAVLAPEAKAVRSAWRRGRIAVRVDPGWTALGEGLPDVVVDATLAKRNLGTRAAEAPLVIALGPGFTAGRDAHMVVETQRGHYLGRLLTAGRAAPDTGVPGAIAGVDIDRVLRAPAAGAFEPLVSIGQMVSRGAAIGSVGGRRVTAAVSGVLRGLIRPGIAVAPGMKLGDIDPRGDIGTVGTLSEKARSLGGAVLLAVMMRFNRPPGATPESAGGDGQP